MSAPCPRRDLEDALTSIEGLAIVLRDLNDPENGAIQYCARQLMEHYREAHDAFCRIYKLDDYAEPAALARRMAPG